MLLNMLMYSCILFSDLEPTNEEFQERIQNLINFLSTCTLKSNTITCNGVICHPNATCISTDHKKSCRCKIGFAGDGNICGADRELDGFSDTRLNCASEKCVKDNCRDVPNSGQEDLDKDGIGDSCDNDIDNDGILQPHDNCKSVPNADQLDADGDGIGDACDTCPNNSTIECICEGDVCGNMDNDTDGVKNKDDNCPLNPNLDQTDADRDGIGDICDNCKHVPNVDQSDADQDRVGDACDTNIDLDEDGIQDDVDNCPNIFNPDQLDTDGDSIGDKCDPDKDNDSILNTNDNCELVPNLDQKRSLQLEEYGDACVRDKDADGIPDIEDVCPKRNDVQAVDFRNALILTLALPMRDREFLPLWTIRNNGSEIEEETNSLSTVALARPKFEGVDFSGTMFVRCCEDDDYIGFVFSYQNLSNYYAFMWKSKEQHGDMGIAEEKMQLRLFHINHTVSQDMIWSSPNPINPEVKALWSYPPGDDKSGWEFNTAYRFHIIHRPKIGLIRITIESTNETIESGNIFDKSLQGGRIGILSFSQEHTIFSNVKYRCNEKVLANIHKDLSKPVQREIEIDKKAPLL